MEASEDEYFVLEIPDEVPDIKVPIIEAEPGTIFADLPITITSEPRIERVDGMTRIHFRGRVRH